MCVHKSSYKSTWIILKFSACSFGLSSLYPWHPSLHPISLVNPPRWDYLLKCFTHPHSSSYTPCLGAGCVPEWKANNPSVQEMGQTEGSWGWKEFWKQLITTFCWALTELMDLEPHYRACGFVSSNEVSLFSLHGFPANSTCVTAKKVPWSPSCEEQWKV